MAHSTDQARIIDNSIFSYSFLLHGADIITTASYQASVNGYQKHLGVSASEALDLIGKSVTIAKEAKEWFMAQPQV